jgi:hypothetical protein
VHAKRHQIVHHIILAGHAVEHVAHKPALLLPLDGFEAEIDA